MRAIDADELIETCKSQLATLEEWSKESGLETTVLRKGYSMTIDLLRSAETLNVVPRHEYDRTIGEYEFFVNNLKEGVPIAHVGYDDAQMGREK